MIRLADDIRISTLAGDGIIERVGKAPLCLPGQGARLQSLAILLHTPQLETSLREALDRGHPESSGDDLVGKLLKEEVCVAWDLGSQLADLHRRTTLVSEWPAVSPELEIGRILRESMVEGAIELLPPALPNVLLTDALAARRTIREFTGDPMSLGQLATLLALGAGSSRHQTHKSPAPLIWGAPSAGRTYPSGGALYPVEPLVYPLGVETLAATFYYYQALSHRLVPFSAACRLDNLVGLLHNHPIEHASAMLLLFVDFARLSFGKYGEKTYRLALLEAGHLVQNVLLVATGLGLAGLPICGFDDEGLSRAAGLNFPYEAVVYVLALGTPYNAANT